MFSYKPLPTKSSIRVIALRPLPGQRCECPEENFLETTKPPSELEVDMRVCDLDSTYFFALSYTWGAPYIDENEYQKTPEPAHIWCDEMKMPATRNLYDALVAMRDIGYHGLFWVDAICINQSDLEERSTQVLMMGDIYASTAAVFAWLGPHKDGFDDLLWAARELLPLLQSDKCGHLAALANQEFSSYNLIDSRTDFWRKRSIDNPLPRLVRASNFYRICQYFTRAWIVQEMVLGRVTAMICGQQMVYLQELEQLAMTMTGLNWVYEIVNAIMLEYKVLKFPCLVT